MRELLRMCHDVPAVSKARLAAAVTVRGEVLAWGTNELRTHPSPQNGARTLMHCSGMLKPRPFTTSSAAMMSTCCRGPL